MEDFKLVFSKEASIIVGGSIVNPFQRDSYTVRAEVPVGDGRTRTLVLGLPKGAARHSAESWEHLARRYFDAMLGEGLTEYLVIL